MGHEPVLGGRVAELLAPALEQGGVFVDATLGRAGHARLVLEASPRATLVGIDRDPDALEASRAHLAPFGERVVLVRDNFENLAAVLERLGHPQVRGVLLDLGVSSPQLDEAARGFSYRHDGPLDMRMDPSSPLTADDVVNGYALKELESVIRRYGEERFAGRIARSIVDARPIKSTARLADVVKEAVPPPPPHGGHLCEAQLQAFRIEVNRELQALETVLPAASDALEPEGRAAVLSYHSLEDRRVSTRSRTR